MLVLGCGIRRDSGRSYQLHDVDQQGIVRPIVKRTFLPQTTADLYPTVRAACRVAREGVPGPVFVEVPANLYMVGQDIPRGYREDGTGRQATDSEPSDGSGLTNAALQGAAEAAAILRQARRPLLYLGAGAVGASDLVEDLAERLESPVSTTFQGKGVFTETHPLWLWPGFGDAAPGFVRDIVSSCDATLAIGCRFSEVGTGSYGLEPPQPLVHVDLDPEVPGRNYPARLGVHAEARAFVEALLDALGGHGPDPDLSLRGTIRNGHESVWDTWLEAASGSGVTPAHLLKALQDGLPPDAIYTTDSGNGTFLAMECLRLSAPGRFLAPVDFSCMGYAVPAALGAKLGAPEAPVVALAGDGAFLMTGLELLTAAREGLGVIVLVLRDRELAQIAQFQGTALGRQVASRVPDYDLESFAAGLGVEFLRLTDDEEIEDVVGRASIIAESGRPVLLETSIDYSSRTYFTRGVVKTNLLRLPLRDRARFVGRALLRRLTG
jgi:acetolactate synthase-1/2/3 large subunit